MPNPLGIWFVDTSQSAQPEAFILESGLRLEDFLVSDLDTPSLGLLKIGHIVLTNYAKFMDLMALGSFGNADACATQLPRLHLA